MRIAFFSDTAFPQINGISRSISNSLINLKNRGHKVILFTHEKADKLNDVEIYRYRSEHFFKHDDYDLVIPNLKDIFNKLKNFNPDIIHIHTPTIMGYVALRYGKKHNIPVIGTYHTYLPEFLEYFPVPILNKTNLMKKIVWKSSNWFFNQFDRVIIPNEVIKEELIKNGLKIKIDVISNGVDLKKFYIKRVNKKYKSNFLHVGRIGYEKSVDIIIKAFSLCNKKTNLIIVGKGPEINNLKELSKKLGVNKRIKFVGAKAGNELLNYYNGCDVFVTASTIETEGIVLLEAMACGKPIIVVNKLAAPKIIKKSNNGLISEPGNYKQFAENMNKLYKNKKLRNSLGKNSLCAVKEYSLENNINKLEKIYESLI